MLHLTESLARLARDKSEFVRLLEASGFDVGLYRPAEVDRQTPHLRDEVYVVAAGSGNFVCENRPSRFGAGDAIYVPAGKDHRFEDFTSDFCAWVIFIGKRPDLRANPSQESSRTSKASTGIRMTTTAETNTVAPVIATAAGPPPTLREATSAIALGVISLLLLGVAATVLGALQDEHRLGAVEIGQVATLEALVMGLSTGVAAAWLPPRHLRRIGALAAAALCIVDVGTMGAHSTGIFILRTFAGVPDGILLWITIGMIARSAVPARWAGMFLTAVTASQLVLAIAYVRVIPSFGADGAFAALGIAGFAGIAISFWLPDSYAPLPKPEGESGMPPLRGWIALFASLLIMAAIGAVGVYLQPLAHQAGLTSDVARTAVWVSLAFQIVGGSLATYLAHRLHYLPAFVVSGIGLAAGWAVFDFQVSALVFVAANALAGFMGLFVGPFIVPMTIEADPSLRAAMQSAGAQVLGGAIGPLIASFVVSDRNVRGVVLLGLILTLAGMAIVAGLHVFALRKRKPAAAP